MCANFISHLFHTKTHGEIIQKQHALHKQTHIKIG